MDKLERKYGHSPSKKATEMSQYQFSPSQLLENGTFLNMQSDTQLQSQILSTF